MESVAFAVPIMPGRTEAVLKHAERLLAEDDKRRHGAKAYADKHGMRVARMYHQTAPVEQLVIYLEAPNINAALTDMHKHQHEVEEEFAQLVEEATGHRTREFGPIPSHIIVDWHPEEGHKHRNPRAHLKK